MHLLEWLAEQRLEQAARDGVFDHLPGSGKPLALDDDRLVPEDVRMAYRLLRNAGFAPPEVEARKEAAELARIVAQDGDDAARRRAAMRLALLEAWLEKQGYAPLGNAAYFEKLLARFERNP
jgi:hypothetical protein